MPSPLKLTFQHLEAYGIEKSISLENIIFILRGQGSFCIFLLLSIPFCIPIQIPGLSTPFGLAISFLAYRKLMNKKPYVPKKFKTINISGTHLKKITRSILKFEKFLNRWSKPRFIWINNLKLIKILIVFLSGLILALPIPFTNMPFGWTIALITLGHLMNDGLITLLGYSVFILTLTTYVSLLF